MNEYFEDVIVQIWKIKVSWVWKSAMLYGAMLHEEGKHGPSTNSADLFFLHSLAMYRGELE